MCIVDKGRKKNWSFQGIILEVVGGSEEIQNVQDML